MKTLFLLLSAWFLQSPANWSTDFEAATVTAKEKHQLILLNFSGSDWCGPCIRLKREIFADDIFKNFADSNLVLVNADFPRNKKNELSKELTKQNEKLADRYNPKGRFPFTLLLSWDGKVLKTFDGFPNESVLEFVNEIKTVCNANSH
jgi:thioredoxin-related protein